MSEKSKFTKREWIHLIITLSVIQAFIWWISFQFAGNSSALGYVSFAGTLISIILAVLAIGYTYGESHQQKNSSTTLANQIESLVAIKDKLEIQTEALNDIKLLKDHLKSFSDKVDNHFVETHNKIGGFTKQLNSIKINDPYELEQESLSEDQWKYFLFNKVFTENQYVFPALIFILVVLFFEKRQDYDKIYKFEQFMVDQGLSKISNDDMKAFFGAGFILTNILDRLELTITDTKYIDQAVINLFNDLLIKHQDELIASFDGAGEEIVNLAKKSKYFQK